MSNIDIVAITDQQEIARIMNEEMQAKHDALADSTAQINNAAYVQSIEEGDNGKAVITKPKSFIDPAIAGSAQAVCDAFKSLAKKAKEQLIYTPEIALTHGKPEADMLCRVEHGVALDDDIKINTVTFKFETDSEICVLDKDGHIDAIDKEWFIAYHPISTKTELEVAQEKQIDNLLPMIDFIGGDTELNRARLIKLQENNELSEIVLPLEK